MLNLIFFDHNNINQHTRHTSKNDRAHDNGVSGKRLQVKLPLTIKEENKFEELEVSSRRLEF